MSAIAIQDQLAERIESIQRKHATIGIQVPRHGGRNQRGNEAGLGSENLQAAVAGNEKQIFPMSNLKSPESLMPLGSPIAPTLPGLLAIGLNEIDQTLGGGFRAGVHEWYAAKCKVQSSKFKEKTKDKFEIRNSSFEEQITKSTRQFVPLCILVHLAWRALEANPSRWIIWIGKDCFPYPAVLVREAGRDLRLLRRSLFVRAESAADRVWVTDLSIRCGLAGTVVADGSGLDMAATRRLQLAAKSQEAFVFLARPPQDFDRLSAAATRWMVRTKKQRGNEAGATKAGASGQQDNPQWNIELLRCKGMQPSTSQKTWLVEWNRATNVIDLRTPVCNLLEQQATRQQGDRARRHSG